MQRLLGLGQDRAVRRPRQRRPPRAPAGCCARGRSSRFATEAAASSRPARSAPASRPRAGYDREDGEAARPTSAATARTATTSPEAADRPPFELALVRPRAHSSATSRVALGYARRRGTPAPRAVTAMPDSAAHASDCSSRDPRAGTRGRGRVDPLLRRRRQAAFGPQVLAGRVDPAAQPGPRRSSASWATSTSGSRSRGSRSNESSRAAPNASIDASSSRSLVDVERGDLGRGHPAPGVLGPFAERDQAQEQLPRGLLCPRRRAPSYSSSARRPSAPDTPPISR